MVLAQITALENPPKIRMGITLIIPLEKIFVNTFLGITRRGLHKKVFSNTVMGILDKIAETQFSSIHMGFLMERIGKRIFSRILIFLPEKARLSFSRTQMDYTERTEWSSSNTHMAILEKSLVIITKILIRTMGGTTPEGVFINTLVGIREKIPEKIPSKIQLGFTDLALVQFSRPQMATLEETQEIFSKA